VLRKIAIIYCVLELLSMGFLFVEGVETGVFNQVRSWISWTGNILGISAVLCYGLGRTLFPKIVWILVLIFYVGIRIYELYPFGLVPVDTDLHLIVIISLRYAYFVIPSILCLYYFCFNNDAYKTI
jgi:hypothetical protein